MRRRLGDYLVRQGLLTPEQCDEIFAIQSRRARPFGVIAEERFGVDPALVERAWATQLADFAPEFDLAKMSHDEVAAGTLDRRQAWQFRLLPMTTADGELALCTTREHLPRALRFAGWKMSVTCQVGVIDSHSLADALMRFYPMAGMGPEVIRTGGTETFGRTA